ncbi:MAG: YdcH family protein [Xanthobacter sp.]
MSADDERELRLLLERLRQEHRDLDSAIEALDMVAGADILQIKRLKKRKLALKDRISLLEDELFPDIIA